MDELFGPPLTGAPGRVDGWVFSLDGWPLLYVDREGAAVNDLRSTLAFGHQVWFEHLAAPCRRRSWRGARRAKRVSSSARGRSWSSLSIAGGRPTSRSGSSTRRAAPRCSTARFGIGSSSDRSATRPGGERLGR